MRTPRMLSLLVALVTALTLTSGALVADVARAAPPPPFDWTTTALRLPWTAARLAPGGPICPGGLVRFGPVGDDYHGIVVRERTTVVIGPGSSADVNGDGLTDTVITLNCGPNGPFPGSTISPTMAWYFVYTIRAGRPVLTGYITSGQSEANPQWFVTDVIARPGGLDVTTLVVPPQGEAVFVERAFRWSAAAHRFLPDRPLPLYPQADRRP